MPSLQSLLQAHAQLVIVIILGPLNALLSFGIAQVVISILNFIPNQFLIFNLHFHPDQMIVFISTLHLQLCCSAPCQVQCHHCG